MFTYSIKSLILLAVLGGGLAACSQAKSCVDPLGCVELDRGQSLTIGVAAPLTGPNRLAGEAALAAVQQAAAQKKSIYGHNLRVQKTDFDCAAEPSATTAERLTGEATLTGVIVAGCLLNLPSAQNTFIQAGASVLAQSVPQAPAPSGASIFVLSAERGSWENAAIDPVFATRAAELFFSAISAVSTLQTDGSLEIPRQALQTELKKTIRPDP
jgi:hypothetical protein